MTAKVSSPARPRSRESSFSRSFLTIFAASGAVRSSISLSASTIASPRLFKAEPRASRAISRPSSSIPRSFMSSPFSTGSPAANSSASRAWGGVNIHPILAVAGDFVDCGVEDADISMTLELLDGDRTLLHDLEEGEKGDDDLYLLLRRSRKFFE